MEELYRIGISEKTIKNMMELVPSILEMSEKEIIEKELILKKINCDDNQIINIISSNPMYLDRTNDGVLKLINKLKETFGMENLKVTKAFIGYSEESGFNAIWKMPKEQVVSYASGTTIVFESEKSCLKYQSYFLD